MPLYNRIRVYRKERGLTLAQLAEAAGCDLAFLWRQEMQRAPTPDALKLRIAAALGQPITTVFFQQEASPPTNGSPLPHRQSARDEGAFAHA